MISRRIKTIASCLEDKKILADVGCDHGYLIIEGFLNYHLTKAYAIDNKEKPLMSAKTNISKYPFFKNVDFLLSDGLEKLNTNVDVIVFAGMGGLLIIDLIKKDFSKLNEARLIIQANRNIYEVRKYLTENGYYIFDEKMVYEDEKYYEILVFEKAKVNISYSEQELYFGPIFLKKKESIFNEKLKKELTYLESIPYKTNDILEKINMIKEILW